MRRARPRPRPYGRCICGRFRPGCPGNVLLCVCTLRTVRKQPNTEETPKNHACKAGRKTAENAKCCLLRWLLLGRGREAAPTQQQTKPRGTGAGHGPSRTARPQHQVAAIRAAASAVSGLLSGMSGKPRVPGTESERRRSRSEAQWSGRRRERMERTSGLQHETPLARRKETAVTQKPPQQLRSPVAAQAGGR